jgi:hypothetical protein
VLIDDVKREEAQIGKMIKRNGTPMDVYTFDYSYWDTMHYYSGGKDIHNLELDQIVPQKMFFVMLNGVIDNVTFPEEFASRLKVDYKGWTPALRGSAGEWRGCAETSRSPVVSRTSQTDPKRSNAPEFCIG